MPLYSYKCENCMFETETMARMESPPAWVRLCPKCGFEKLTRDLGADSPKVGNFEHYVEEGFNGKPIDVTSPKQRDALCEQHGVTYDSRNSSQRRRPSADFEISEEDTRAILTETEGGKKAVTSD